MTDDDLAHEFHELVSKLPYRRYRHAVGMLARQAALAAAGASWADYFAEHRHRLLEEAAQIIANRQKRQTSSRSKPDMDTDREKSTAEKSFSKNRNRPTAEF